MRKMFLNKKGDKVFSFWWILVWIVVAGAVVLSTNYFYGAEVDVRQSEANSLNERILDCIMDDGFLVKSYDEKFDVFENCKISRKVFEGNDFYFRISVFDEDGEKVYQDVSAGKVFETECGLVETALAKHYPKCSKTFRNVFYNSDEKYKKVKVEILTASNQIGERGTFVEGRGGEFGGGGFSGELDE